VVLVQQLAQRDALNRLKTVRGHLDGIIRMVEDDAYCVDLMKQVSAVQSSLEKVNRLILRNHLETCFSEAVDEGRGREAIAELMDAVKFDKVLTGGEGALAGVATGEVATTRARRPTQS
jgi:DNA-binding FrmR family transcriptional regulator